MGAAECAGCVGLSKPNIGSDVRIDEGYEMVRGWTWRPGQRAPSQPFFVRRRRAGALATETKPLSMQWLHMRAHASHTARAQRTKRKQMHK